MGEKEYTGTGRSRPLHTERPWLFLGGFEVGVLAGGVVGYVDDVLNLGDGALHGDFDSLREGDGGETAALATAGEPQIGGIAFDGDEVGPAAVDGDGRVYLLV